VSDETVPVLPVSVVNVEVFLRGSCIPVAVFQAWQLCKCGSFFCGSCIQAQNSYTFKDFHISFPFETVEHHHENPETPRLNQPKFSGKRKNFTFSSQSPRVSLYADMIRKIFQPRKGKES